MLRAVLFSALEFSRYGNPYSTISQCCPPEHSAVFCARVLVSKHVPEFDGLKVIVGKMGEQLKFEDAKREMAIRDTRPA